MLHICAIPPDVGFSGPRNLSLTYSNTYDVTQAAILPISKWRPSNQAKYKHFKFYVTYKCNTFRYRFLGEKYPDFVILGRTMTSHGPQCGPFSKWRPLNQPKYENFQFYVTRVLSTSGYMLQGTRNPILPFSITYDVT